MFELTHHDRSAVTQDNDRGNQAPDPGNQLEELGHKTLINCLDVLGKTVHDAANWLTLEPPHGSMEDTFNGFGVECTAGADRAQENGHVEDDYTHEPKKREGKVQQAHQWRVRRRSRYHRIFRSKLELSRAKCLPSTM